MKTQMDARSRIVSLENLKAMCEHVSGTSHRFSVESVSNTRVRVTYSNPDEYGSSHPITATFPCYLSGDAGNPTVVLEYTKVTGDDEAWQSFEVLRDCPSLFRDARTGKWRSHLQIRKDGHEVNSNQNCGCTICDAKREATAF